MQYSTTSANPARRRAACAVVGVFEDRKLAATAKDFDAESGGLLTRILKDGDISGRLGETLLITSVPELRAEKLLLVGCGNAQRYDAAAYRKALAAAIRRLGETRQKEVLIALARDGVPGLDPYYLGRQSAEVVEAANYRFDELKSKRKRRSALSALTFAMADRGESNRTAEGLDHGARVAVGVQLARDVANRPGNVCAPVDLAREAKTLAARYRKLDVQILNEAQMKRLGMGALLSVSQGSEQPPRMIVLRYRGAPARVAPIALIGKAITFDSGGISIKPPPGMDEMKFDKCGGTAVLGTLAALAELQPAVNVVGIIPACENMPSGRATRPGDVVTSMSGQTIEILNTDAEGRLILCDAITFARRFKPDTVIDAATLTGSCVIALGNQYNGVFSPHDDLAEELLACGARVGDPAWRLPVNEDYGESLKSNFADFANAGTREGGASIAAAFLARFTDGLRWAHLDVAGSAWARGREKGATGRPVALLTEYVLSRQQ